MKRSLILPILVGCLAKPVLGADCLTNAQTVSACLLSGAAIENIPFEVVGRIDYKLFLGANSVLLSDESGSTVLNLAATPADFDALRLGDTIRARGQLLTTPRGYRIAETTTLDRLGNREVPGPLEASGLDIAAGRCDFRLVRVHGILRDALRDDIDSNYTFLILVSDGTPVTIPIARQVADYQTLESLIGAHVSVSGLCNPIAPFSRPYGNRLLAIDNLEAIAILDPAPARFEELQDLAALTRISPTFIAAQGYHSTRGRVIAVTRDASVLLLTPQAQYCRLWLADNAKPPRAGDYITAMGLPSTDLFHINLTRAKWKPAESEVDTAERPQSVSTHDIYRHQSGQTVYSAKMYGKVLSIKGRIGNLNEEDGRLVGFYLESDGRLVEVDCAQSGIQRKDVPVGAVVQATGACLFDVESGHVVNAVPHIYGLRLVLRGQRDIVMLSRPPWWTPALSLAAVGFLSLCLLALLICYAINRNLQKLRLEERTRLAVELHDSVSQNLTGASMQIDSARQLLDANPAKLRMRLDIASKTIDGCREELRNCIRNLRSETLDAKDLAAAINDVLTPFKAATQLRIRFNVSRRRLTDSCTHTILRIVRELVTNAVRHGKSSEVLVAGALDKDAILFSVKDNGCGFNTSDRPGIAEGHFGLDGIAERVRAFNGSITVDSSPGNGARISVTLRKDLRT